MGDARVDVDVAHQRDLRLECLRHVPVAPQDQRVGLDTDVAQGRDRVLGRLGLELAGRAEVRHERHMQEEDVLAAHVVADLARGLEEGLRLDVADGATDLGDHDVRHVALGVGTAMARMRLLISSVMCGITWTVSPRYSPRRSLAMTAEYTWPVVTFAKALRSRSRKRS